MYTQELVQQQSLSPSQLLSLKILMMDTAELEKFIHEEYTENPLLEITSPSSQLKTLGDYFNKTDYYISDGIIHDQPADLHVAESSPSLSEYLLSQLTGKERFTADQWRIFILVINTLDHRGFLAFSPAEIAFKLRVPVGQVIDSLDILQNLEPAGVCATNLQESLILQIRRRGIKNAELEKLIACYLPEIAAGKYNKISKITKISRQALNQYVKIIKSLNPRPCQYFGTARKQYIVPDVVLSFISESWVVAIQDNWSGSLGISKLYQQYCTANTPETCAYVEEKIRRARLIISCVESRRKTLHAIMSYIAQKQHDFLLHVGPLKGLSIKEAANDLSIHPSSFSRALHNKYIQTPRGVFPGKYFFQKSRKSDPKDPRSSLSISEIKKALIDIIDNEPKSNPHSDTTLAELLADKGIILSRRSIAKYRQECNIKSSYERKRPAT